MGTDEWDDGNTVVVKERVAGKTVRLGDRHVLHHAVVRLGVHGVLKLGRHGVQRAVAKLLVEAGWGQRAAGQCDAAR